MKLTFKTLFSFLILAFTFSSVFSMEYPNKEQQPLESVGYKMNRILPSDVQASLTKIGHEVLEKILHKDGFNVATSGLFDKVYPQLQPVLGEALYSKLASWKPSNLIRWGFSSVDQDYIQTRKNQMIAIVALSWAMTDLAKQQNDFFERGSFSIIDPNHRLTNFLLGYVKLTTGYEDPQAVPFALTTCNFAYRRDPALNGSSHHNGRCPESQFGVDVRFEPSEGVLKLLPFDGTHLLFAKLNIENQAEPLLFLKLEEIGMGSIPAMVFHGLGFLHSQNHVAGEARREKDIQEPLLYEAGIQGEFKTIRAMYLEAQKFLIPTAPSKDCSENNLRSTVNVEDSILVSGIGEFYQINAKDIQEKAKAFIDIVDGLYPNGNNHLRIGNEVIIDLTGYKIQ